MISANGARTQPVFFRSYEQVRTAMFDLQARYPELVHVEDIGDSWQTVHGTAHRDVLALRLTSPKGGGLDHKPTTAWLGSVHPTELANPELLLRWATKTAAAYGTDADATALLDGREIDMVPIVNVDGHASVEEGYATGEHSLQSKRKNNHEPDGIDLNRNFDFRWDGDGSSPDPKSSRYRGTSPASEPETQAVQRFLQRVKPSVFIDWHSPGKDILYPWGWTTEPAPRHDELKAVAEQFGHVSGYTPEQAIDYSNTNGTTEDFAYGRVGALAFTVETGPTSRQTQAMYERSWKDAAPIMDYAATIADAPGERAMGPSTSHVAAGATTGLLARVSDAAAGGQAIRAAEAFTDPTTPVGQGVPLAAVDGAFDSSSERVRGSLDQLHVAPGALVQVRAQDAEGHWGPAKAAWVAH
jgi:hypothetical protein